MSLSLTHDARARGDFAGRFGWMIDPSRGGSGTFDDLGLHLAHLLLLLWPEVRVASCRVELVAGDDGLSDVGGRAEVGLVTGQRVVLRTSSVRAGGVELDAVVGGVRWRVQDGMLMQDERVVLDGPGPSAGTAVTAFLDQVTGHRASTPLRVATADEALAAQRLLASITG